jgi:site-specific DNA-methyltransferase (adenine-specific)
MLLHTRSLGGESMAGLIQEPPISWDEARAKNGNGSVSEVPRVPSTPSSHRVVLGDARDLSFLPAESVHLVVTSPPYFDLKQYAAESADQLGEIHDHERFLDELDKVWLECRRVLVPGELFAASSGR